jgi:hypothetical protein
MAFHGFIRGLRLSSVHQRTNTSLSADASPSRQAFPPYASTNLHHGPAVPGFSSASPSSECLRRMWALGTAMCVMISQARRPSIHLFLSLIEDHIHPDPSLSIQCSTSKSISEHQAQKLPAVTPPPRPFEPTNVSQLVSTQTSLRRPQDSFLPARHSQRAFSSYSNSNPSAPALWRSGRRGVRVSWSACCKHHVLGPKYLQAIA